MSSSNLTLGDVNNHIVLKVGSMTNDFGSRRVFNGMMVCTCWTHHYIGFHICCSTITLRFISKSLFLACNEHSCTIRRHKLLRGEVVVAILIVALHSISHLAMVRLVGAHVATIKRPNIFLSLILKPLRLWNSHPLQWGQEVVRQCWTMLSRLADTVALF